MGQTDGGRYGGEDKADRSFAGSLSQSREIVNRLVILIIFDLLRSQGPKLSARRKKTETKRSL